MVNGSMDDIESICNKLIMIDNGKILYDGLLSEFKGMYCHENILVVDFQDGDVIIDDERLKVIKWIGTCFLLYWRFYAGAKAILDINSKNRS